MNNMDNNLKNQLYDLQTDFFKTQTKKNHFYKNDQKKECAEFISSRIDISFLLSKTVFITSIRNTVFFDYTIFKTFANPTNYATLVDYTLGLFKKVIDEFGSFQVHVNLDSYTVSGCQRFKDVFTVFIENCLRSNTNFSALLDKLYIYNTPNVMDMIMKIMLPFIDPIVKPKIVLISKKESPSKMNELFQ